MVNKELERPRGKRDAYLALNPAQKYLIGKHATESGKESGVATTIRHVVERDQTGRDTIIDIATFRS